jgi:hypothetical protein
MTNLLALGMTESEVKRFAEDHVSGRSDTQMSIICHLFSSLCEKHDDSDTILDAADAAMYRNAVRRLSVVRELANETVSFALLTHADFREIHRDGQKQITVEPQVFIAAIAHNPERDTFDLHYNFIALSKLPDYFPS